MDDQKNKWTDGWRYNSSPILLWHANHDAILSQLWSLIESLHRNRPFCNSLHNRPRRQCPFSHPYRVFIPYSTVYMNDSKATIDFKFCSSGKPLHSRDRKINVFSVLDNEKATCMTLFPRCNTKVDILKNKKNKKKKGSNVVFNRNDFRYMDKNNINTLLFCSIQESKSTKV